MYIEEQPYFKVPALYLKEDEHTEHDYQRIKEAVESFKGNLEWHFGKAYPSRLNYEIVPKIIREIDNCCPDKLFKDAVSSGECLKKYYYYVAFPYNGFMYNLHYSPAQFKRIVSFVNNK
ncbi:hypothetical protein [uncultured Enterococcus sp.]|uniref:hypothetical protein n=1 Tax=uncultured Enterococcus sp. TaxID=167972 RepID=UPI002AA91F2F|nr:hypothetical protein [uncultured Enterococcus sp.]